MINWLLKKWRARQRSIDLQILWPTCKQVAPDIDHAKAAFMFHCADDPAWTRDYDDAQLIAFIDKLQ